MQALSNTFGYQKLFLNGTNHGTRDKSIVVDDNELERLIEHCKDFGYSNDNCDESYPKYRNEFAAVKNRRVYDDKNPLMSLEFLNENNVCPVHTFTDFVKIKKANILESWIFFGEMK